MCSVQTVRVQVLSSDVSWLPPRATLRCDDVRCELPRATLLAAALHGEALSLSHTVTLSLYLNRVVCRCTLQAKPKLGKLRCAAPLRVGGIDDSGGEDGAGDALAAGVEEGGESGRGGKTYCTIHPASYTWHPAPLHPIFHTRQTTPYTLRPAPCTLHPAPYTLHPAPCTLHPTPYTLHPASRIQRPGPHILHPVPYTLHPTPCTLHPTPYTLHRTPHTAHRTPSALHPMLHTNSAMHTFHPI